MSDTSVFNFHSKKPNHPIFFCLPAASVDAGYVPSERLSPSTVRGQPSAGFHPSPTGRVVSPFDAEPEEGLALQIQPRKGWKPNPLNLGI